MSLLWHLVKYNLIFNKIRLMFLGLVSLLILGAGFYFHDNLKDTGESIMQYCLYVFFVIFTGKMNAKNNLMFDIKQILAMPMSKQQIVFYKSIADIVHYLPVTIVFLLGFYFSQINYHIWIVAPAFLGVITAANIYSLNKRVDFSRMQHSSASFKNSFLYLHKYLGLMLQMTVAGVLLALMFVVFKEKYLIQELIFLMALTITIFVLYTHTLKILKDESLSYFVWKRDIFRIGWKACAVGLPLFFSHMVYKGNLNIASLPFGKAIATSLQDKVKEIPSLKDQQFVMAIVQGDEKLFDKYISEGVKVPWSVEVMGGYPLHLAVSGKNKNIVSKLLEMNPESLNKPGKFEGRTPLFSAIRNCHMEMIDLLITKGADINIQSKDGSTPIIYAAKRRCYGGVIKLKSLNANTDTVDKKGNTLANYFSKRDGMNYILGLKKINRDLASEKKTSKLSK